MLLDLEHGGGGEEQIRDVVPAAGSYGVPTVVRVESAARIRMGRVLDNGAAGSDLGKYGLANPAVSFTATNDAGKNSTFVIGKKDGSTYFARDLARPTIFHVNSDLDTQLTKTLTDLRDKKLFHFDTADINRVEIQNEHGDIVVDSKGSETWVIASPDAQKGRNAVQSRIFDPITTLQSSKIIDHPGGDITSKLAKPGIQVTLTDKNKQATTLRVSKPAGDIVYAQVSGSPSVYTLTKSDFDGLNFAPSLLVQ